MIVGVLNEADKNENRVAISPEIIKKLNAKKIEVFIEQGCFIQADFTEKDFTDAGLFFNDPVNYSNLQPKINNIINYDFKNNKYV